MEHRAKVGEILHGIEDDDGGTQPLGEQKTVGILTYGDLTYNKVLKKQDGQIFLAFIHHGKFDVGPGFFHCCSYLWYRFVTDTFSGMRSS